ncbi:MAG: T9SS type A sorting domain-containing protein [Bacteroidota bacterium]
MKIRLLFPTILILFMSVKTEAQIWFGDGDKYVYSWGNFGEGGYMELTVSGDSVIGGQNYKVVERYLKSACLDIITGEVIVCFDGDYGKRFAYQQGDSIFYYSPYSEFPRLQYDFSLVEGDTFKMVIEETLTTLLFVVDSVGSVDIMNATRKVQYFTTYTDCYSPGDFTLIGKTKVIEGFGIVDQEINNTSNNIGYLFPEEMYYHLGPCVQDGEGWSVRCFSNSEGSWELVEDCYEFYEIVNSTLEKNKLLEITVSPNPASDKINIDYPTELKLNKMAVYSIDGTNFPARLINDRTLDISNLNHGIYIIKFQFESGETVRRFVKN